jgi:hypothetical protein
MFLLVRDDGLTELHEQQDFMRFSVRICSEPGHKPPILNPKIMRFETPDVAWVRMQALEEWPDIPTRDQWLRDLALMTSKAGRFGWISADGSEIRAHVERIATQPRHSDK